jgi:alcohol dehydrogenase, propanol-preferring
MIGRVDQTSMRAMRLASPASVSEKPLELVEMPVPTPGAGEALIAVHACGVCHTDLHIVEGELEPHRSPVVPGHQIVGEVVAFGDWPGDRQPTLTTADGRPLELGDRVGVPWLWKTDGRCRFCRRGDENLCDHALFTGYDVDGGYAEYVVAPAGFVYRLPEHMSDLEVAPLLCAGIIGYRCLRLTGVLETGGAAQGPQPRRLGLYGFGAAAHICLQLAVHRGWEVHVFTRGAGHRDLAVELGAAWAGATDEPPGGDFTKKLDAAIVFAPSGELALDALKAADKGAVVAMGGIHSTPIPPIDYEYLYGERVLRSVANSTRADALDLLRVAPQVPVRTHVQVFPLEQANEALLALKQGRIRGAAVLQIR